MTAEDLSMAAGVLLSLGFSYLPGLSEWYGGLSPVQKRLVMLGLLTAVALAVFGLACTGLAGPDLDLPVECDQRGAIGLLKVFLLAVISNQAVYTLSPRRKPAFREQRWLE